MTLLKLRERERERERESWQYPQRYITSASEVYFCLITSASVIETKSSPENIETRNPSNDCKINEQTDRLTITDKKSSIQEN